VLYNRYFFWAKLEQKSKDTKEHSIRYLGVSRSLSSNACHEQCLSFRNFLATVLFLSSADIKKTCFKIMMMMQSNQQKVYRT
jgi:hypothetical protein